MVRFQKRSLFSQERNNRFLEKNKNEKKNDRLSDRV